MVDSDEVTRLRGAVNKLARQLNAVANVEGLTPTQLSVLSLVASRGPVGLADLAAMEALNPTMLSRVVAKLGESGLLRRQPNPSDLRAALVEVTDQGRELHLRMRAKRTRVVSECLDRIPAETVRTLLDAVPALEALTQELRQARGTGGQAVRLPADADGPGTDRTDRADLR